VESMSDLSNKTANGSFAASAGLLSMSSTLPLPDGLTSFSEPIGLILALVGTILKLVEFVQKTRSGRLDG
jgi:hypothetical protein